MTVNYVMAHWFAKGSPVADQELRYWKDTAHSDRNKRRNVAYILRTRIVPFRFTPDKDPHRHFQQFQMDGQVVAYWHPAAYSSSEMPITTLD